MRIAAAGDIHGGEFLEPFERALRDPSEADLLNVHTGRAAVEQF